MQRSHRNELLLWLLSAVFCFAVVFWSFWPMLDVPPFEHHSILLFEHGAQNDWSDFLVVGHAAGLRLLPFYSFIVHVKTTGFAMLPVQIFNVASISLSLLATAAYARHLTGRIETLLLVPLLFFPCFIWWQTVEWTPGRQETMVLIFSGIALALCHARTALGWSGLALVGLLLVCAGLSKETGMIAMLYVGLLAIFKRDRRYLVPAIGSFLLVLTIREMVLVHPYSEPGVVKCEDMSFLTTWSRTCVTLDFLDLRNVLQITWNVFLGVYLALVPQIFDRFVPLAFDDVGGMFQPEHFDAIYAAFLFACLAALATTFVASWRIGTSALTLIVLNAVILAAFWRLRNMGIGLMGGLTILSFGWLVMLDVLARSWPSTQGRDWLRRGFTAALILSLFLVNLPHAERFRIISEHTAALRRTGGSELACEEAAKVLNRDLRYDPDYRIDPQSVEEILWYWGVDPTGCNLPPSRVSG